MQDIPAVHHIKLPEAGQVIPIQHRSFLDQPLEARPIGTKLKAVAARDFRCVRSHYRNSAKSSSHIPAILSTRIHHRGEKESSIGGGYMLQAKRVSNLFSQNRDAHVHG